MDNLHLRFGLFGSFGQSTNQIFLNYHVKYHQLSFKLSLVALIAILQLLLRAFELRFLYHY
jgi:hypothetical protein